MEAVRLLLLFAVSPVMTTHQWGCLLKPIDLGRSLDRDSIAVTLPFTPGNLTEKSVGGFTYRINDFCVGEHTGTHMDAPFHFNETGWKIAEIPLERLIANGVFMNFSEETANNASFRLQPYHIDQWLEEHGPLPDNAVVLISFGWAQLYSNRTAYTGSTSSVFSDFVFPGTSADSARKLASMPQVVGVGVDTPVGDPSGSGEAHQIFAAQNIYVLEGVDLDQPCLPDRGYTLYSMPLKLAEGTGAPARVIAVPYSHFHFG